MAGYLLHVEKNDHITLSRGAVSRLLKAGNGDAALLYLAILAQQGSAHSDAVEQLLGWDQRRLSDARASLEKSGLLTVSAPVAQVEEAAERPNYTQNDVVNVLQSDGTFAGLLSAVESLLGFRLTTPDMQILLNLYRGLALPADVIYLLVSYCKGEVAEKSGASRRLSLAYVEKVGYEWHRCGVDTQEEANRYITRRQAQRQKLPRYMQILGLGDRKPSTTEDKYLMAWIEAGFDEDLIALAYDKTVVHCKELRWGYMNGILKRWMEKGVRTAADAMALDAPEKKGTQTAQPQKQEMDRMKEYLQKLHGKS